MLGFTAILTAAAVSAGLVQSGTADDWIAAGLDRAGFRIANIEVSGEREMSEIDVITQIDMGPARSLFSLDAEEARRSVAQLPWVADVQVVKTFPDTLHVRLTERVPVAVWQSQGDLWMVDAKGAVIAPFDNRPDPLPHVIGAGAESAVADLRALLAKAPAVAARMRAAARIGKRRWDLHLEGSVVVRLPETGADSALERLSALQVAGAVLDRDVAVVDLRVPGGVVVTPGAAAKAAQAARLAAQDKARRQAGRRA